MAEDYISQFYTWDTGNTITAARLNGNVSNVTDGLSGGTKAINIGKLLLGGIEAIDSSRNATLGTLTLSGETTTTNGIKLTSDGTGLAAAGAVTFGAADDAGMYFDGTDLIIISDGAGASGIILDSEDDTVEIKGSGTLQATFDTSGLNLVSGDAYYIDGTSVLNATTLGSAVVSSSLTSLGTLTGLTVAADVLISDEQIGSDVRITVANTDNTDTASDSKVLISAGGSSAGNPAIQYLIDGVQSWYSYVDNDDSDKFKISANNMSGNDLVIDTDGNVGIGTSSPSKTLHVYHATENTISYFESGDTEVSLDFIDSTGTATIACRADFRFSVNSGSEAMRIDTSGNVGIGSTSPTQGLTLEDKSQEIFSASADPFIKFSAGNTLASPTQEWVLRIDNSESDVFQIRNATSSTNAITVDTSNNVGIGTASPLALLHVDAGDVYFGNESNTSQSINLRRNAATIGGITSDNSVFSLFGGSSSANHLVLDSSGNVGIGNTSPSTELDVTGTGTFSTGIDAGGGGTPLKFKVIDIGDWDMDGNSNVNVAHGLDVSKIRMVEAIIRNDDGTLYFQIDSASVATSPNGAIEQIGTTNVLLDRLSGGRFDDTDFNATGYNRGWVTIWYE